jgi:hypothetical protein
MRRRGFTVLEGFIVIFFFVVFFFILINICGGYGRKIFFRKDCSGRVTRINHFNSQPSVSGVAVSPSTMFSSSVEISSGDEFVNFSSEDRQFGTIGIGDSVRVAVFKYPPWDFEKVGTYYGGRLLKKYKVN